MNAISRVFRLGLGGALLFFASNLWAQSEVPRLEVGAHFSYFRLASFGAPSETSNDAGVGGRFTVNLTRWLGAEAALNYFPKSDTPGNRTIGLFGMKAGWRGERWGIFAKARPGVLRFGNPRIPDPPFPFVGGCSGFRQNNFALDVGGVVEGYPSRRTVVRVDAGDTIAKLERRCAYPPFKFPFTTHNPQVSVGFGFRF